MSQKLQKAAVWFAWHIFPGWVVCFLIAGWYLHVHKPTSTEIVSDRGAQILNDQVRLKKLNAAIENFKKNGYWDYDELKNI